MKKLGIVVAIVLGVLMLGAVAAWLSFDVNHYRGAIQTQLESPGAMEDEVTEEDEALVEKCLEIIRQERRASTSMLQRRLRLGYTRAARVVDILERRGILGPGEGAKPREILVDLDAVV